MLSYDSLKPALKRFLVPSLGIPLILLICSCGQEPERVESSPPPPPATEKNSEPRAEFKKLIGKWLRPDGGYVLEVRSIEPSGKAEVGYFNPSPINVSRATVIQEGEKTRLFVELRDVNYPGCTYALEFDPVTEQLFGEYYQAGLGQTYDITFERMKGEEIGTARRP